MTLIAWQATVQDDEGNVIVNPSITVRRASDDGLADIFDSEGEALDNPYTGTSEGFVQFSRSRVSIQFKARVGVL